VTDRTYDRWAEPSRDTSWDESREQWAAGDAAAPRQQQPQQPQQWADPRDPRWTEGQQDSYREPTQDTRWGMPPVREPSHALEPVTRPPAGSGGSSGPGRQRRQRRKLKLWQEIPLLLVIALGIAFLVQTFLFRAFYIPSSSMEDTLVRGDRVLVNKVVYHFGEPERGEVIVFRGPANWTPEFSEDPNASFFSKLGSGLSDLVGLGKPGEKDFIKRVIGVPGDRVSCCDVKGRIFVNGTPVDEPYVTKNANKDSPKTPGQCGPRQFDEVVVEPGMLFVMGDNRFVSQDSRCRGLVPIDNVIGRAGSIVWPFSRWDGLSAPDPFQNVPAPASKALGGDPANTPWPAAPVLAAPLAAPVWLARRKGARSRRLRA